MQHQGSLSQPLSEAELDQLSDTLAGLNSKDALSLEGLDGFFCTLIASPEGAPPNEYLPVIWGADIPDVSAFANLDAANAAIALIMRHWNSIIADLDEEGIHLPVVMEPAGDAIPGRAWARGFMRGVQLAPLGWSTLFTDENEGHLMTIPLVAGEVDPEWPKEPLSAEAQDELLKNMAVAVTRSYEYFADDRLEFANEMLEEQGYYDVETYRRPEPKTGRNDPCPCGSGRKYKKCCGVPDGGPVH